VNSVHLVRVTTDDDQLQLWTAATPRDEAVDQVLSAAPKNCTAKLLDARLKPRPDIVRSVSRGEVRELSIDQKPQGA
jgi:hypothetical protein